MKINKLIEYSQKDRIGKYFLKKAVFFSLNSDFGKAYEFLKEGLDILTCDCIEGNWLEPYMSSDKRLFNDISINHIPHFEYYFVKAYFMAYEEDEKNLYQALDAIEKYLEIKNDEIGCYVKARILWKLNEKQQSLNYLEQAMSCVHNNSRLLYRFGRIKEQGLNQNGLNDLYNSFVQNPSSACCVRVLKKYMKERSKKLIMDDNESNPLIIAFNNDDDERHFQNLYERLLNNQIESEDSSFVIENSVIITNFIQGLMNNYRLFIEEDTNNCGENDNYYQSASDHYYENSNSSSNPWEDVFGEGDEADAAYWNTD